MQRRREITYDDGYGAEEEDIPLHRKQAFGAGLKRKRVEFVPAKDPDGGISTTLAATKSTSTAIGDLYASIVLKGGSKDASSSSTPKSESAAATTEGEVETCPICSLPATTSSGPHEVSLAHQVCLTHSHPPSHLDRSRMGLRALKAQGWDPDARRGLGREGEGMMYPIKVVAKEDTLGVGAKMPESVRKKEKEEKPKKLNPKEMRKLAEKEKRRNERLQGEIFGRVDVERYLRGDGSC
ncbi:hypothetical protein B0T10DRAFT_557835 [Thelonectria olida]|uniref:G-patch domain-containing protein n=1 Tax=Thelonectria olida TaxID=1576542 RepID=A0A9P9ATA0_9HYPO|nr:hypothetical protein B0T10DRAFT_557835 [Thelonectria olida]